MAVSPELSSLEEIGRITATPELQGTILKYKADRGPVAYVMAVFMLRLTAWAFATPLLCAAAVVPLAWNSIKGFLQ